MPTKQDRRRERERAAPAELRERREALHGHHADAEAYERLRELTAELETVKREREQMEDAWLEASSTAER